MTSAAAVAFVLTSPFTYLVGGRVLLGWQVQDWSNRLWQYVPLFGPLLTLHLCVIVALIVILPKEFGH